MQRTITVSNQNICYRVSGTGSPVMLVHGFGEDGTIWERQVKVLQDAFQLIVPDLPGSGASELTDDVSMEGMAAVLKAILDDMGIEQCVMIGHSMGGYVTLAFAEKYPGVLQAFGLFHSTAYADSEEKIAARRRGIQFIREQGPQKFLEQSIRNLFSEGFRNQHPEVVKEYIARYTNFPAESLVSYYEAMIKRPDRTDVLRKFPEPVLFIIGVHDNAVSPEQGMEQSHIPRLAYVRVLKHSGHMGMIEEAAESTAFLQQFLTNCKMP